MKMMKAAIAAMAGAAALVSAGAVNATTLLADLTANGASGGLNVSAPYGQVSVDDTGGTLAFTVTLKSGLFFRNANDGNHHSFGFNLNGIAAGIGSITDNGAGTFDVQAGPFNQSPFGTFAYGLECNSCSTGYNANSPTILNFVVTKTGGGSLTVDDLTANNSGYYFSADVTDNTGSTGNVGAGGITKTAVPEPASWLMMIMGFGGLGAVMRRRRETLATA